MNKILPYVAVVLSLAALLVAIQFGGHGLKAAPTSASSFYDVNLDSTNGIGTASLYVNGTAVIASSSAGASVRIGGGTTINTFTCATSSLATTTSLSPNGIATTSDIALTGSVQGDLCFASLSTASSTKVGLFCNIAANGTGTLQLTNMTAATITTIAAGIAKVCFLH